MENLKRELERIGNIVDEKEKARATQIFNEAEDKRIEEKMPYSDKEKEFISKIRELSC